jgi:glutamyl-tRNA reductase
MLDELVIANFPRDCQVALPATFAKLQWQTCLRQIVFLHQTELSLLSLPPHPTMHIYRGQQAYQFLLEVVSGLHSPLLGETAVMGQFRAFRASATFASTAWGRFLRQLTTDLLVDARHIRHQHLQSLGCQSYGSLIRKHVKSISRVTVLGTGSLAQEILPWLMVDKEIRVLYRSRLHAERLQDKHQQVQLEQFPLAESDWEGATGALVITAPLKAIEIHDWLELQSARFSLIVDLRGEAETDRINVSQPLIKLSELFASLNYQRKRLDHLKLVVVREIELITQRRYSTTELLCA